MVLTGKTVQKEGGSWKKTAVFATSGRRSEGFKMQRYNPPCWWWRRGEGMRSMGQSELTLSIISVAENMQPDNSWHT